MEMQTQELGTYGAKRISWRSDAARNLLQAVLQDHRGADEQFQLEEFAERVLKEREVWKPIIEYFFANHRRSLLGRAPASPQVRARRQREQARAVEAMKVQIVSRVILMDWVLPNGKRIADSTFGELAKLGGWLAKVAKKGKPNQVVGKVLTEKQLRAIK